MNKIRLAFRRWRERGFRDARSTFFTIMGLVTAPILVANLVLIVLLLLH